MPGSFIDSNVVLYGLSQDDAKQKRALAVLAGGCTLSIQVLNETANIMRRKLGYEITAIRSVVRRLLQECGLQPVAPSTILLALDVAERYGLSYYDSLIVATSLEADCDTLYSEDMQHGQVIEGRLTIINPFR